MQEIESIAKRYKSEVRKREDYLATLDSVLAEFFCEDLKAELLSRLENLAKLPENVVAEITLDTYKRYCITKSGENLELQEIKPLSDKVADVITSAFNGIKTKKIQEMICKLCNKISYGVKLDFPCRIIRSSSSFGNILLEGILFYEEKEYRCVYTNITNYKAWQVILPQEEAVNLKNSIYVYYQMELDKYQEVLQKANLSMSAKLDLEKANLQLFQIRDKSKGDKDSRQQGDSSYLKIKF